MKIRDFFDGNEAIYCPVAIRRWSAKKEKYERLEIVDPNVGLFVNFDADYMSKNIEAIYIKPYNDISFLVLEICID